VSYPTIANDTNILILERDFTGLNIDRPSSAKKLIGKTGSTKNPWGSLNEQFKEKGCELIQKYKVYKGLKHSLAVKVALNQPEEVKVVEQQVEKVEEVVDPKKKK